MAMLFKKYGCHVRYHVQAIPKSVRDFYLHGLVLNDKLYRFFGVLHG